MARTSFFSSLTPRVISAYGCYLLSMTFLMQTGMSEFWAFSCATGLSFAIAWVLMTTIAWQWKEFGDPRCSANILGHLLMFANFGILFCRLTTRVDVGRWNLLDALAGIANWAANFVGLFPEGFFKVLSTPGIMVTFVLVLFGMSLHGRKWAAAMVATVVLMFGAVEMSRADFGEKGPFFAGIAFLCLGMSLQFSDFWQRNFWTKVVAALEDDPAHKGDLELKYRVLKRLLHRKGWLSVSQFRALVSKATGKSPDSAEVENLGRTVLNELIHADDIAEIVQTPSGEPRLILSPSIFEESRDFFWAVATIPKIAFTGAICLLWIVSPIDVIPDAWPFVGMVDDAIVSIVAAFTLRQASGKPSRSEPEKQSDMLFDQRPTDQNLLVAE